MHETRYVQSSRWRVALLAAFLASLTAPGIALADPLSDTHLFRLGVYEQDIDVAASATRRGFPEVEIDFDESLGLDESATSIFFQYQWRFKEKWTLSAFYTTLEADGEKIATRDFNWDGQDYQAGLNLSTEFNVDTYLIAADYSFIKSDRLEVGAGFGLHAFDIETTLEIEARIEDAEDGESARGRAVRNNSDLLAPLPNVRGFARYMVTPKWAVMGSLGWLSFNYEDYDGDYLFLTALTEYRFTENFGVGFAYQVSEIDVSNDNGKRKRKYDIDQYGPSIYLTYGF